MEFCYKFDLLTDLEAFQCLFQYFDPLPDFHVVSSYVLFENLSAF